MNVYRLLMDKGPSEQYNGQDGYCRLLVATDEERKVLDGQFRGVPMSLAAWKPIKVVRMYSEPENLIKPLGDRAAIDAWSDPMVLSRRALDELVPYIGRFGQVLPLTFDECDYSLFNITNVVDAVDLDASETVRYPDGGLSRIRSYVFRPKAVRDHWIFKIPQYAKGFAFVTDRFVEVVHRAGLTGFGFELLWSDKEAPAARAA
jgi:hypothetical protein